MEHGHLLEKPCSLPGQFALGKFRQPALREYHPLLAEAVRATEMTREERPLPVALLPNHLCQHRLKRCDAEQRDAWR
jgi:hypothetical protein